MEIDKRALYAKIGYEPHDKQWLFHNSEARFRVPVCGRRFGKSTMAARDCLPQLLLPKQRGWIIGPTYDLAEKEFRVIWDDLIIGQGFGRDKRVKKAYNKRSGEMYIELPWQTRVECRSADHPENLVGEALDFAILSEAAKHKEDTWNRFVQPSLSDKRGWAVFPTTPEGFNWLYKLWLLGKNPDFPQYEGWCFPSWENRVVYPGGREDPEILLLERTLSEVFFAQEIGADFRSFVGKIYGDWNDDVHLVKHTFRPDWPNYIAFDWGFANPLAAIEFQVAPDDTIYVWREHYESYLTLPEHVAKLRNREQPSGYRLDLTFGDAADPEAAAYISANFANCMAMPEAKENWRQGVETVALFLKSYPTGNVIDEFDTPEERPHFFVDFDCTNFIHEINNYRTKTPVKGQNVPEMGQKMQDHAMDAIRYGLMHLFVCGARSQLTDVYDTEVSLEDAGYFTAGVAF